LNSSKITSSIFEPVSISAVEILEIEGGRVRIPPAVKNKLKEAWDHVSDFCSGVWEGITKP
jgi:hypothetical protein